MSNFHQSRDTTCDRKVIDCQALLSYGSADGAYQLLAEAAECATKGAIMRCERLNRWPSREERPALHKHGLADLFAASCLRALIDDEQRTVGQTRMCYHALKGLHLRRYQRTGMPRKTVRQLVDAFTNEDHGVLRWLRTV